MQKRAYNPNAIYRYLPRVLVIFLAWAPSNISAQPVVAAHSIQQSTFASLVSSTPGQAVAGSERTSTKTSWIERYLWPLVSGLLLGVVVTVIGALLYDKLRRNVRTKLVTRPSPATIEQLHSLYLQRIDSAERVSPVYITDCLGQPQQCISSSRQFARETWRPNGPPLLHLILAAKAHGGIVGLLKALYVRDTRMLFIAYVATQTEDAALERRTMPKLLTKLSRLIQSGASVDWVSFEITKANEERALAKDRLFRQYAETFGVSLKRVDLDYLQPDLDCRHLEDCEEVPASLYIGAPGATPDFIAKDTLSRLIDGIYLSIYFPTWMISHADYEASDLREYVQSIRDLVIHEAPERIALI